MAIPFEYNLRNVMNRPVATFTTALGIGLTVALFIGALALAAGFRAALVSTGRDDNAIVLRKGADSEISSGLSRDQVQILRASPEIATGPAGRPPVTADLVVVTNKDRLGQAGSSNIRPMTPTAWPPRRGWCARPRPWPASRTPTWCGSTRRAPPGPACSW